TLGHASMALETETSLYIGLGLLVIGTGFFKPNITSIISEMYKDSSSKKDGAYTIFYMGVNAGAFFGILLCGYLAEKLGWSYGFGLAGIFMLLGTLQFWLSKALFGQIGEVPSKVHKVEIPQNINEKSVEINDEEAVTEKQNPFTLFDKILIFICSILGLGYAINDPLSRIAGIDMFSALQIKKFEGQYVAIIFALILFLILVIGRIMRYTKVIRDRMLAFIIFAFFTVFFWMSFEQGASSLILFARDSVNRVLSGNSAIIYNIINALLTVIPLIIISYVLFLLWKKTFKKIPYSNITLMVCFALIWGLVGYMLNRDFNSTAYEVSYKAIQTPVLNKDNTQRLDKSGNKIFNYTPVTQNTTPNLSDVVVEKIVTIAEPVQLEEGQIVNMINKDKNKTNFAYLSAEHLDKALKNAKLYKKDDGVIKATVQRVKSNEVEITVSWFSILNSFFIIAFASFFSRWFDSKKNPSAAAKYALGLIIMALGFGLLAYGSYGLQSGAKVSMLWLVFAYLFHTLGELSLSPVGLSYVSKLVPPRMIAFMFGMWYLAIAIGSKLAAVLGGQIENITKEYSLSTFFLIFTIVPILAGLLVFALNPLLKKLMHGVR
ncbi:MAG: peptide MFS transporter, partial [Polaribacter sp.]